MKSLNNLLKNVNIIAILCNQWGDTGKGKFSDYFAAYWADVVGRGTGGNNAGHTVVVNGEEKIFHLLPAGITHDSLGKTTILGKGMAIDLHALSEELGELDGAGLSYNNLMVSKDAHIVMPYHVEFDGLKNKSQKAGGIGSTGKGIGPCYTDKAMRKGIRLQDLFDTDSLAEKVKDSFERYEALKGSELALEATKLHRAGRPLTGKEASDLGKYNVGMLRTISIKSETEKIIEGLKPYIERVKPFVRNTDKEMQGFVKKGKKILLEGAQGLLLSIDHGTYPYVTSSDPSLNGTANGVGLSAKIVDLPIGIVKFPFMTRVGGGPFPTELGGRKSEEYCAGEISRIDELSFYGIPYKEVDGKILCDSNNNTIKDLMNSVDEFERGVGIRLAAGEYGATTGRPRRVGWTDGALTQYAVGINGPFMIVTKPDTLTGIRSFKMAYGYRDETGFPVNSFESNEEAMRKLKPDYIVYKGYDDVSGIKNYDSLPLGLRNAMDDLEEFSGGKIIGVSVGPDRDETIVR